MVDTSSATCFTDRMTNAPLPIAGDVADFVVAGVAYSATLVEVDLEEANYHLNANRPGRNAFLTFRHDETGEEFGTYESNLARNRAFRGWR